ncbi:hypothetical protein GUITHDRAFT_105516 [Guillardia theta CCMP2712]|uniref:Uncharacterized protein n=2 Tax=Guillardia theta TaxID=55529 RepID=L1JK77_GUITC|nr:hypothetical protein GUITHDRAFT_105516 [Guillardia theta CCMP2712]EKX48891.1 hypothetical protein GUITHDRAFT_105516 [Guillardia theta CCMP2712]|mmetsp:Transcript_16112/g.54023  ORF Transcript_16112/g.54023 Transcript_16112/m.54023 type:complete len:360 (+) Transcript_16112:173-1252(+)|eukprot:XP_005835871.1 hypothetical protein GUITHDRAFT_105516 [Guillardia theta CCMP2712]
MQSPRAKEGRDVGFAGRSAILFAMATVSKAIEPILIDLSQSHSKNASMGYEYSLASAMAMAELMKAFLCFISLLAVRKKCLQLAEIDLKESRAFAAPAVMLAIANQTLFVGISYLGALFNQIARKAVCIMATAMLSQMVLGHWLSRKQKVSLVLLTVGFCLLVPNIDNMERRIDPLALLFNPGFIAAVFGGCCTAAQGVYFERASKSQDQSVLIQTMTCSLYGFVANGTLLILSSTNAILMGSEEHSLNLFKGYTWQTLMAITSIALADMAMALVFKFLDATSYNFCRVFATWLQGFITFSGLFGGGTSQVTGTFIFGSILVTAASILYKSKSNLPCVPEPKMESEMQVEGLRGGHPHV